MTMSNKIIQIGNIFKRAVYHLPMIIIEETENGESDSEDMGQGDTAL